MSIESDMKRIADALEAIVMTLQQTVNPVVEVKAPATPAAPAAQTQAPPPPAQQPAQTQAPAAPVAPAAPAFAASMTPEELNNALVVEFKRLGSREAIDNAMAEFGVTSVKDLPLAQYQPLLAKIQAIPA